MRDRRVGCDDQIEFRHHGGRVDESVVAGIEIGPERLDRHVRRQASKLLQPVQLLQTDEAYPGNLRQRMEFDQRDRSSAVDIARRISLPANTDIEAFAVRAREPRLALKRLGHANRCQAVWT